MKLWKLLLHEFYETISQVNVLLGKIGSIFTEILLSINLQYFTDEKSKLVLSQ